MRLSVPAGWAWGARPGRAGGEYRSTMPTWGLVGNPAEAAQRGDRAALREQARQAAVAAWREVLPDFPEGKWFECRQLAEEGATTLPPGHPGPPTGNWRQGRERVVPGQIPCPGWHASQPTPSPGHQITPHTFRKGIGISALTKRLIAFLRRIVGAAIFQRKYYDHVYQPHTAPNPICMAAAFGSNRYT